jgi:hypothetical protein
LKGGVCITRSRITVLVIWKQCHLADSGMGITAYQKGCEGCFTFHSLWIV